MIGRLRCAHVAQRVPSMPCRAAWRSVTRAQRPHLRTQAARKDLHGPLPQQNSAEETWDADNFIKLLRKRQEECARPGPGKVYLVGTGPGDPGLLTLRAVQLMQTADVVLYDRLVSDDILQLVHGGALMVYVGKQAGYHTRTQAEIHELLLQFAEAGAIVVRLKGGDPYVFGRGGEEVQHLQQHGIQVHCVPGITAAAGICAELGIPMTHRGIATSVRFLTGHVREGGESQLDDTLTASADPNTTLIVYMGLGTLPLLVQQLQAHGMPSDVPAVAVERGTTAEQRVVYNTLEGLHGSIQQAGLKSPTLLIIGQVVRLAPGWTEGRQAAASDGVTGVAGPHDCARLQLPDAVSAVLSQQQQPQPQQQPPRELGPRRASSSSSIAEGPSGSAAGVL